MEFKKLFVKKIKAFTILELSVVMVISGIVFGIAFSAYNIILKQFQEYKNGNEKIMEISTVSAVLNKDFSEADEIRNSQGGLNVIAREGSQIIYRFEDGGLLRKANQTEDRFENISNVKITFRGIDVPENNGLVDEVYFELWKETFSLQLKKYYAADKLIENNKDTDNGGSW